MRLHENHGKLWLRQDDEFLLPMLRAERLAAARFEPVMSHRTEGYMDVLFEHEGKWLIVSLLLIDAHAVLVPERSPIAWPARLAFNRPALEEISAKLLPWFRSISSGRMVVDERIRFFRDGADLQTTFSQARERSLLGAAPYREFMKAVAPAVYALRLARNGRVALRGPNAAGYASILASVTQSIDADVDGFDRNWLAGIEIGPVNLGAQYACYVGPRDRAVEARYCVFDDGEVKEQERRIDIVEPIPMYVSVSFDPQDAPVYRSIGVTECGVLTRSLPFSEPPVKGGSSGVVRLIVRDDADRFPDADSDGAHALAARLSAEGFDAQVTSAGHLGPDGADVVHIFGLHHGPGMIEMLRDLNPNTPVVVSAHADDRQNQAVQGCSGALLIPRASRDLVAFGDYSAAFEKRRLSNLTRGEWYNEGAAAIMRRAQAAIVVAPGEERFLRERFGFAGPAMLAPAYVPLQRPVSDIGSVVGSDDFILLHAPLEPRCNQVFAAIAAKRAGLPLVLLGDATDTEYFYYVNEAADPNTVQIREQHLSEGEIAGLYARARVVADISWSSRGLHRLARGAAFGAAIAVSALGYESEVWSGLGCCPVDPGGLESIVNGFLMAWERQPVGGAKMVADTAVIADPFAALVATLSAYQQAVVRAAS